MRPLLTADCGNSTIDVVDHRSGQRRRFGCAASEGPHLSEMLAAAQGCRFVVSTVSPPAMELVSDAARAAALIPEVAGVDLPCPIALDYEPVQALGSDRWLGAMAAFRLFGSSLVIDCGSATTINHIDHQGVFRGGAIGPGLRAMTQGMSLVTPGLPVADLDGVVVMPARRSEDAVTAGVLLGYAGLVERLVASCLASARSGVRLVLTGGNADRLLAVTRLQPVAVPDLVHRGLVELAGGMQCGC